MSSYKFKLNVVDPDKNIVTIAPTRGTWMKWTAWSLAPSVLMYGGLALMYAVSKRVDESELAQQQDEAINLAND